MIDIARVRIVRGDTRNAAKAVGWALGFAIPRAPRVAGLALIAGLFTALLGAALVAGQWQLAGGGWATILGAVLLQQAHALARTWVRATWLASELALVEAEVEDAVPVAALELPFQALGSPGSAASIPGAGEERPEVLVVVKGEAGEGGQAGDERLGGGDLAPEIAGRLPAEGDAGRGDAGAGEPREDPVAGR